MISERSAAGGKLYSFFLTSFIFLISHSENAFLKSGFASRHSALPEFRQRPAQSLGSFPDQTAVLDHLERCGAQGARGNSASHHAVQRGAVRCHVGEAVTARAHWQAVFRGAPARRSRSIAPIRSRYTRRKCRHKRPPVRVRTQRKFRAWACLGELEVKHLHVSVLSSPTKTFSKPSRRENGV